MMHPDLLAEMAGDHRRTLLREAEASRLAHHDQTPRTGRLHQPARPWFAWQLRSPIVRRPPAGLECT
ncbi:MAG: hypothetical protein M3N98_01110 [Actinomycetota bacterium]|nr:hypothetical protein [Actinomycetota bacterium]